jgi:superfamily II RNA helicase
MIKICSDPYPSNSYNEIFKNCSSYELSDFQKYSIQALVDGHHSLVTAATGSGKTLPAEFAIKYFTKGFPKVTPDGTPKGTQKKKKVIYTSPIKALSNQKYHDFKLKFPDITFGLLTGDIKCGIGSDCMIMTCEILKNALLGISNDFELDFENDLACVIFDEVHYINDESRGHVWEQCIIALLKYRNVQLLMLSATIDQPENFAKWVAELGSDPAVSVSNDQSQESKNKQTNKQVWLSSISKRIVPLKHYSFLTCHDPYSIQNITKEEQKFMTDVIKNKLILLKDSENPFIKQEHAKIKKFTELCYRGKRISKQFVINECINELFITEKLPAIFFTLSRKNVESFPSLIEKTLLTDTKDISSVEKECRAIVSRLPNYKEFMGTKEYEKIVKLMEKGIAYHHSGMLSIYREIVEIMFEKGYVKLLFATETFSVGINMPTRTVIFDSFSKFDGNESRLFMPHEYIQMAGRAGRRSIDDVGYVIHLNNLFKTFPTVSEYCEILNGAPQKLKSRFVIDFNCVLGVLNNSTNIGDLVEFIKKSSISNELKNHQKIIEADIKKYEKGILEIESQLKIPLIDLRKYMILMNSKQNNKTKREILSMENLYSIELKKESDLYQKYLMYESSLNSLKEEMKKNDNYVRDKILNVLKVLQEHGFVKESEEKDTSTDSELVPELVSRPGLVPELVPKLVPRSELVPELVLTNKGIIAANIQEANGLVMSEIFYDLDKFEPTQIASLLSMFINSDPVAPSHDNAQDLVQDLVQKSIYTFGELNDVIHSSKFYTEKYEHLSETLTGIKDGSIGSIGSTGGINYEFIDLVDRWTISTNEEECLNILNSFSGYIGSFIKNILKLNNLVNELIKTINVLSLNNSENSNNLLSLKYKLNKIPELTLKFIVTNQSLYI